MNAREFEIVWGLALLLAAPIVGYIFKLLSRFFSRRRPRTADDGAAEKQAAAPTTSVATPEATTTSLAETSAPGLEGIATLHRNGVTAEQQREEPATTRQVGDPSTLIPSDSATSSTATRSHSLQNHMPSREYADNLVLRNSQTHFPLTNHSAVAVTPEAQEEPAIARQVDEALTSPTHVLDHSQLRHRKPLIDVADILALRDPQSPFPPTNRLNRSRSRKLRLLLAIGVLLLVGVLLLLVKPGMACLKFWNVLRQTAKVDAATGGETEVANLPVGLPAAPTSLHCNRVDGRGVVLLFPSLGKPTFVLSPEVQKVPHAYIETWFRAVESLLMMVRSRELDLHTKIVDHNTCSRDHTDCDNMNQIKMVLRGFSNVPRQTSKVGLPVAPTSLHFDVGGRVLDLPFPSPRKQIFVLSPEVQEVSRAYAETWFQAVENLLMIVYSYGSSDAWRDRFIGLRPGQTFCFFHPRMAISADPPRSNPYPPQMG